jgi:hypothetical protein
VGHSHLQSARKHQADHGEGADQHADRDQPVPEFAHSWRIKGPPLGRTASPQQQKEKRSFLADCPSGHNVRQRPTSGLPGQELPSGNARHGCRQSRNRYISDRIVARASQGDATRDHHGC